MVLHNRLFTPPRRWRFLNCREMRMSNLHLVRHNPWGILCKWQRWGLGQCDLWIAKRVWTSMGVFWLGATSRGILNHALWFVITKRAWTSKWAFSIGAIHWHLKPCFVWPCGPSFSRLWLKTGDVGASNTMFKTKVSFRLTCSHMKILHSKNSEVKINADLGPVGANFLGNYDPESVLK